MVFKNLCTSDKSSLSFGRVNKLLAINPYIIKAGNNLSDTFDEIFKADAYLRKYLKE